MDGQYLFMRINMLWAWETDKQGFLLLWLSDPMLSLFLSFESFVNS
jgi:hypothetical protein